MAQTCRPGAQGEHRKRGAGQAGRYLDVAAPPLQLLELALGLGGLLPGDLQHGSQLGLCAHRGQGRGTRGAALAVKCPLLEPPRRG